MMRVYLAARCERQDWVAKCCGQLRAEGVEVTTMWADVLGSASTDGFSGIAPERRSIEAMLRIRQVVAASLVVVFADPPAMPDVHGNKHVELGVALALSKRVMVIGPSENIYHDLPDVEHFDEWDDGLARILTFHRDSDLLTTRQAAREANTTSWKIREWITAGELRAVKRDGAFVIARGDLDQAKAARRRKEAGAR